MLEGRQLDMHLDLNSNMKSNFNTDGRTNERDVDELTVTSNLTAVDAGARTGEADIPTLRDVLANDRLWMTDERHPVIRSGERDEIQPHIRAAVWYRDRGKCELCGEPTPTEQPWHLDHIKPWSAGGPDDTTNLRVLCERHNVERSNRYDPTERPRRAATWWCLTCYSNDDFKWDYTAATITCRIHRTDSSFPNPWRCRVARAYRSAFVRDGVLPTWHKVDPLNYGATIAYCAHCDMPGLTSRAL